MILLKGRTSKWSFKNERSPAAADRQSRISGRSLRQLYFMYRKMKHFSVLLLIFCLMAMAVPLAVSAVDYNDSSPDNMITEEFNVEIGAGLDYNFHITETIRMNFVTAHHGIYRYIPESDDYAIKNVRLESGDPFVTESDSGYLMIKIGDAYSTLTGEHTYVLSYDLDGYKDTDASRDVLRIDLLPTGWETSIREAQLHLSLPAEIDWEQVNIRSGQYGSGTELDGHFTVDKSGTDLFIHGTDLPKGYGVSAFSSLPDGYWSEATLYRERHKRLSALNLVLAAAGILSSFALWFFFGRNRYRMYRPVTVRPPEGMTPAEVGYYYNDSALSHDMMTMLFYYANKGWLQIRPIMGKREKIKDYELVKTGEIDSSEKKFSKTLFNGIVRQMNEDGVTLKQLSSHLRYASESFIDKAKRQVSEGLKVTNEGKNTGLRILLILISIGAILTGGLITEPDGIFLGIIPAVFWFLSAVFLGRGIDFDKKGRLAIGILLGILTEAALYYLMHGAGEPYRILLMVMVPVSLIFYALMQSPSEGYVRLMGEIKGFRDFIKKADEKRLKAMVAETPEYFYDILPYAVVFGLEKDWSDQFTKIGITPQRPSWYDYNGVFYYTPAWTSRMMSDMDSTFRVTADSGDSGSSFSGGGGGFSGGGFGGGGGGGW